MALSEEQVRQLDVVHFRDMRTAVTWVAVLAVLAGAVFGAVLARLTVPGAPVDGCREVLHMVVYTIEADWGSDAEAVQRAREAAAVPAVQECLAGM